ncbi:MAG: enamine deaminase RidA (YjgF/YER057c/UK114 family) [Verrucomicrobiales bacterium]|jgi:enamine deaminase RidA (YjgF/YER057c/UK114 family)
MSDSIESRLAELNLTLPPIPGAAGSYEHAVLDGNLLHVSGGLSFSEERSFKGKLGVDVSLEEGQEAARMCLLNRLAVIKGALGSLDRVQRIVSLQGYVHSAPDFYDQPAVINGASNLAIEIFGDAGRHARVALGAAALPLNAAVEISLIVSVRSS